MLVQNHSSMFAIHQRVIQSDGTTLQTQTINLMVYLVGLSKWRMMTLRLPGSYSQFTMNALRSVGRFFVKPLLMAFLQKVAFLAGILIHLKLHRVTGFSLAFQT